MIIFEIGCNLDLSIANSVNDSIMLINEKSYLTGRWMTSLW
jgi:hypothetical protein